MPFKEIFQLILLLLIFCKKEMEEKEMLILTRRVKESIIINNDIQVVVLGVQGKQVRIGIKAPLNVTILREELCERKQKQVQEKAS